MPWHRRRAFYSRDGNGGIRRSPWGGPAATAA